MSSYEFVLLTEISIASPPSCSNPPSTAASSGKTYFQHATAHRGARRVQRGAALAVTHMALISRSLQKAAAAEVAVILANNT